MYKRQLYRKSFGQYTEQSLLISAFFYAMCSLFLCGIFIIKYKIELLLVVPFPVSYTHLDVYKRQGSRTVR